MHPYSPRVFQQYHLCNGMHYLVWGISRWKKNKQHFLMDRFFYCPFISFYFHVSINHGVQFLWLNVIYLFSNFVDPPKAWPSTKRMSQIELIHKIWKWKHLNILLHSWLLNYWILVKKTWWFGIFFPYNLANLGPFFVFKFLCLHQNAIFYTLKWQKFGRNKSIMVMIGLAKSYVSCDRCNLFSMFQIIMA
jgi:hypothetical protein